MCVCVCVPACACACACACAGQRTLLCNQVSPSTFMSFLVIDLRSPGLYGKCLYQLSHLASPAFADFSLIITCATEISGSSDGYWIQRYTESTVQTGALASAHLAILDPFLELSTILLCFLCLGLLSILIFHPNRITTDRICLFIPLN